MPLALWALTLSAFAIGTTEFVIVGLLPTLAHDLGVSLPSAGLLVSLYALGVAIGAPVLTALTARFPRKTVLLGLMALFIAGNLLAWLAPGYQSLIAARIRRLADEKGVVDHLNMRGSPYQTGEPQGHGRHDQLAAPDRRLAGQQGTGAQLHAAVHG